MKERNIRVAITHGDTNGIGYEIIFKTFSDPAMLELCTPVIYGSAKVAAYHVKALNVEINYRVIKQAEDALDGHINLVNTFDDEIKVELGKPTPEAAIAALKALDRAIKDWKGKQVDTIVMAPMNNNTLKAAKNGFSTIESYLAKQIEAEQTLCILTNEQLRMASATNSNLPVKAVAETLNKDIIVSKTTLLWKSLKRDFCISNPRIALLAFNPKSGEGVFGPEEEHHIIPAVAELAAMGIQAFGPYPADTFFADGTFSKFDAVLAMYHDQGTATFNAIDDGEGLLLLTGLPAVCTAPINSTGYDAAGRNITDESSFRHAIYASIDVCRNRDNYDEPLANPLPKLYHEKRDDSEKVRFCIPKAKTENKPENKDEEKTHEVNESKPDEV